MAVLRRVVLVLFACVVALVSSCQAFYFELREGDERCFSEEVPAETLIAIKYKSFDHDVLSEPGKWL